jgi:hypothetical protein
VYKMIFGETGNIIEFGMDASIRFRLGQRLHPGRQL